MKVGFVGLGKLGRPLSDVSYEKGHDVTGFDPNVTNRNQPREIVHGSLKESMNDREIVFVCVPTPFGKDGKIVTPAKDYGLGDGVVAGDFSMVSEELVSAFVLA